MFVDAIRDGSTFDKGADDYEQPSRVNCAGGPPRGVTHSVGLLIGMDAGLAPGGEVTVDFEGVARAALVGIDPVLACGEANTAKRHTKLFIEERRISRPSVKLIFVA